jgi:hypothetical protein
LTHGNAVDWSAVIKTIPCNKVEKLGEHRLKIVGLIVVAGKTYEVRVFATMTRSKRSRSVASRGTGKARTTKWLRSRSIATGFSTSTWSSPASRDAGARARRSKGLKDAAEILEATATEVDDAVVNSGGFTSLDFDPRSS